MTPPPPYAYELDKSSSQNPAETVDRTSLTAARKGDMAAFGELVERHRTACLRVALIMLRNRSDAEDEIQNAFCKAFQRLHQYRAEGSFGAWLSRIVENQCLMRLREKRYLRFVCIDDSSEMRPSVQLRAHAATPEDDLGFKEVAALLRREVLRIPPLLRHVMILRDLDQLAIQEVALRLGVSVPAAKSRLMRAREELRSRIQRHCGRKGAGTLIHSGAA